MKNNSEDERDAVETNLGFSLRAETCNSTIVSLFSFLFSTRLRSPPLANIRIPTVTGFPRFVF